MSEPVNRRGISRNLKGRQRQKAIERYDRKNARMAEAARNAGIDPSGRSNAALGMMLMSRGIHPNRSRTEKLRERVIRERKKDLARSVQQPQTDESVIKKFYDSWEWKRLSYDMRMVADATCECCGADPKRDKVRIVCDHIKPIRFFWHLRLDPANVQILCDDCNRGKGSRDITDWR